MTITLQRLNRAHDYHLSNFMIIAKWYNDPSIQKFIRPNFEEKNLPKTSGSLELESAIANMDKIIYFILEDGNPIGDVSVTKGFKALASHNLDTAWISICIGERDSQGKGIGKQVMKLLESECGSLGFQYIELGVFSFNERAIGLYESLGYERYTTLPHFTYHDGQWYDDIRMIKKIDPALANI